METTYSALDAPLENTLRPTKKCTTCCKEHNVNAFIGSRNQETKTCNMCREKNNIQNAKRDREHYNATARKNDAKPERKEVKKKWKENNYEKIATAWMKSRKKQIENLGVKEYLKKMRKVRTNGEIIIPTKLNKSMKIREKTRMARIKYTWEPQN
jgi:hypothetical protein